jgi:hypothetical protein
MQMQMQQTESRREQKQGSAFFGAILGILLVPFLFVGACFAAPYVLFVRWRQQRRERALKSQMKSQGRLIGWAEFVRSMRESGGTCIEERFSAKGPVRFWWTPENVYGESPHAIIDWFTMRKGGRFVPFILWCRERYTSADGGSAVLVETWGVAKKEIYALWAECRPESNKARWIEVAPPEIVPRKSGQ